MKLTPPRVPKTDKRLLGTWRSDRQRTLKEWSFPPGTTRKHRRFLRGIFGKLRLTFTRKHIQYVLKDWRHVAEYRVIGRDAYSVATISLDFLGKEWHVEHIHFDGKNSFWISVGRNREFFKRVS